ncbi:metallophosphoesterase [Halohasta litorea]|uniref:Metallophosphoesterase n=1 Tax=Halohasta litorea TaxID=869891 RepID=A0ABD6D420_9EURY|nr:metallophosphoesterase [Halohasta litorea]
MDELAFRDRAVYLPATETLVVADLHLGREAVSNVAAPLGERRDLLDRLSRLRSLFDPTTVVFAGDLLHSFSTVPDGVEETIEELYLECVDDGIEVVAIEGNHDQLLETVWPASIKSSVKLDDGTVVCHGHEEPDLEGNRYLIGHDHPAMTIEGVKRPCLCVDPTGYRGRELVVLPAFTRLAGGVELNRLRADALQSPLVSSVGSLQPTVWDADTEQTLRFPPLGEFRRLL